MDGLPYTVAGVLPQGFRLLLPPEAFLLKHSDVWTPLQIDYERAGPRNLTGLTVFGRLGPGVALQEAQSEMDNLAEEFRKRHPVHQASDLRIRVWSPAPAELTLFRNGQTVASQISQAWEVPITEPGVYRVEAMRHLKPWIITNPIYVVQAGDEH